MKEAGYIVLPVADTVYGLADGTNGPISPAS